MATLTEREQYYKDLGYPNWGTKAWGEIPDTSADLARAIAAGTATAGTTPPAAGAQSSLEAEIAAAEAGYGPFAQYMNRMGLGGGYQTPGQQYMRGLYDPMRSLYETQGLYGGMMGQARPEDWGGFMGQYAGKPQSVWSTYGNLLKGLFGMGQEARSDYGVGFQPQYDEFGNKLTTAETGERPLSELQSLMAGGLIPQMGQRGAGWLAQRLPFLQENWAAQGVGGGQGTFMDYVREKYNLGQYF